MKQLTKNALIVVLSLVVAVCAVLGVLQLTRSGVSTAFAERTVTELVTDGKFSSPDNLSLDGKAPVTIWENWVSNNTVPGAVIDMTESFQNDGTGSLKFCHPEASASEHVWQSVNVVEGHTYILSAAVKIEDFATHGSGGPGMFITIGPDSNTHWTTLGYQGDNTNFGTKPWTPISRSFTANATKAVSIRIRFWGGATTGTAWVDNVSLVEVTDNNMLSGGTFDENEFVADSRFTSPTNLSIEGDASSTTWENSLKYKTGSVPTVIDMTESYVTDGSGSLKFEHSGESDGREGVYQYVTLVAGHTYVLSAAIKTKNLVTYGDTDAGACVTFGGNFDTPSGATCYVGYMTSNSENIGTTGWKLFSTTFTATSSSKILLRIRFWGNKTTGTAWFDNVSITEVDTSWSKWASDAEPQYSVVTSKSGTNENITDGKFSSDDVFTNSIWQKYAVGTAIPTSAIDMDNSYEADDTGSLKLAHPEAASSEHVWQKIYVEAGHKYTISAAIKTENLVATGIGVGAFVTFGPNADTNWVVLGYKGDNETFGTKDWKMFSETFTAESTGDYDVRIRFWGKNATGAAWFDNVSVIEDFNENNNVTVPEFIPRSDNANKEANRSGSMKLYNPTRNNINLWQKVTVEEGKWYTLSTWIKTKDLKTTESSEGAYVFAAYADATGDHLINIGYKGDGDYGTNDWEQFEGSFQATKSGDLNVYLRLYGSVGTAWFDDVSLIPGRSTKVDFKDPNFESATTFAANYSSWTGNDGDKPAVHEWADVSHTDDGTGSLRIIHTAGSKSSSSNTSQSVAMIKDAKYKISVWIKYDNVIATDNAGTGGGYVQIGDVTIGKKPTKNVAYTADWTKYEGYYTPTATGNISFQFRFWGSDSGTVYFDEVEIVMEEEVDQEVLKHYVADDVIEAPEEGFSLLAIGDPQVVVSDDVGKAGHRYQDAMQELISMADDWNVQYALDMGDLVDQSTEAQWALSKSVHKVFDDAGIKYSLNVGNHDYGEYQGSTLISLPGMSEAEKANPYRPAGSSIPGALKRDLTGFTNTYKPDYYKDLYGTDNFGVFVDDEGQNKDVETMCNTWHKFEYKGEKYLIIAMEFALYPSTLTKIKNFVLENSDRHVIVTTHSLLAPKTMGLDDQQTAYITNVCGTQQLWNEFISKCPNIFLALGGHFDCFGTAARVMYGDNGNPVTFVTVNPQGTLGGNEIMTAFINITNGTEVSVYSYTPSVKKFYNGSNYKLDLPKTGESKKVELAEDFKGTIFTNTMLDGSEVVYKWSSSDPSVVQVSDTGVVTAISAGPATILCDIDRHQSAYCVNSSGTIVGSKTKVEIPVLVAGEQSQIELQSMPENNLIPDGSFDNTDGILGSSTAAKPSNTWIYYINNTNYSSVAFDTNKNLTDVDGSSSLRIMSYPNGGSVSVYTQATIHVEKGKTYTMSAAIKTYDAKSTGEGITVYIGDKTGITYENSLLTLGYPGSGTIGTKDWTVFTGDFVANETSDTWQLRVHAYSVSGIIWVDNISLVEKVVEEPEVERQPMPDFNIITDGGIDGTASFGSGSQNWKGGVYSATDTNTVGVDTNQNFTLTDGSSASLCIKNAAKGSTSLYTNKVIKVEEGKTYRLTVAIRYADLWVGSSQEGFDCYIGNKTGISYTKNSLLLFRFTSAMAPESTPISSDWTVYTDTFVANETSDNWQLIFHMYSTAGTAWIDNVSLVEVIENQPLPDFNIITDGGVDGTASFKNNWNGGVYSATDTNTVGVDTNQNFTLTDGTSASLCIKNVAKGSTSLYTSKAINVEEGKTYRLTVAIRYKDLWVGSSQEGFDCYIGNKTGISYTKNSLLLFRFTSAMAPESKPISSDWTVYTDTFVANETSNNWQLIFHMYSTAGTAWVDNVSLVEVIDKQPMPENNLLEEGSFDTTEKIIGSTATALNKYAWSYSTNKTQHSVFIDTNVNFTLSDGDSYSLCLSNAEIAGTTSCYTKPNIHVEAGKVYTLSVAVRTIDFWTQSNGRQGLSCFIGNQSGLSPTNNTMKLFEFVPIHESGESRTQDWVVYTKSFVAPETSDEWRVYFRCQGCGTVWLDNISLTEGCLHNFDEDGICTICGDLDASISAIDLYPGAELKLYTYLKLNDAFVSADSLYTASLYKAGVLVDEIALADMQKTAHGDYEFAMSFYAKQMTEDMTIVISDGTNTMELGPISIQDYADLYLNQVDNAKGVTLVKAMLNYGAACQILFDYNTTDLANDILENEDKIVEVDPQDIATDGVQDLDTGVLNGITYAGMSVSAEDVLVMELYLNINNIGTPSAPFYVDLSDYEATITYTDGADPVEVSGGKLEIEEMLNPATGVKYGACTLTIENIAPRLLDVPFTVTLTKEDVSITVTRSVNYYNKNVLLSQDASDEQKDVVKALYVYGVAAKAFNAEEE